MSEMQKLEDNIINDSIKEIKDQAVRVKLVALNNMMKQKKELDEEMQKEVDVVSKKYEQLFVPVMIKQNELIEGQRLPTQDELKDLSKYHSGDVEEQTLTPITNYWFKAIMNSQLGQEINERDQEALKCLTKIEHKIQEQSELHLSTVVFHFKENEYFTNSTLTLSVFSQKEEENKAVKSEGDIIEWKENNNLTIKTVKKKQKNKKSGQQRVVSKEVQDESFFNIFTNANAQEEHLAELEDDEADQILERLDIAFDVVQALESEIIPYSLEYYLNIAEDNEDFEDELDDIEEEDEEDEPKRKKSNSKKDSKESKEKQQECKQQ